MGAGGVGAGLAWWARAWPMGAQGDGFAQTRPGLASLELLAWPTLAWPHLIYGLCSQALVGLAWPSPEQFSKAQLDLAQLSPKANT